MTPEQRARLLDLVPKMKIMARRKVSQNDYYKAWGVIGDLERFLVIDEFGLTEMDMPPAEEWIAIAEKAAEGHDKPGTVRMPSLAAVVSGKPPEEFTKEI